MSNSSRVPESRSSAPLVGRHHEVERLVLALQDADRGEARALYIAGEAGAGKSRLVREAQALARTAGKRFATGRALRGAANHPFGPMVEILQAARRSAASLAERAAFERAIAVLLSEGGNEAPATRWQQVDAVVDAISLGARQDPPLQLIALEDLQWADSSTLELTIHVLSQLELAPVVVLITFRPSPGNADALLSFIEQGRGLVSSERMDLGPIPPTAAEDLVRAAAGGDIDDGAVAAIVARAAGNPLFLEEAARDAAQAKRDGRPVRRVPSAIQDLIQRRVLDLDEEARGILYVLAVLGEGHPPTVVEAVTRRRTSDIALSLASLIARGLLNQSADGSVSFRHAITRDAVYESIAPNQRRDLHVRCVEALEAHGEDRAAAEVAEHLIRIGDSALAVQAGELLALAGEQSLAQTAYEQAADQLREAVRLLAEHRPGSAIVRTTRLRLGEALRRTRSDDSALAEFAMAADEASAAGDPQVEALAAIGYEQTYLETGRPRSGIDARSIPLLDRALSHLRANGSSMDAISMGPFAALAARVLASGAQARHFAGQRDTALDMAREAIKLARAASDPGAEAAALNTERAVVSGPDTLDRVLELTGLIAERAREADEVDLELEALLWRILALLELGERIQAEAAFARFIAVAERVRQPWRLSEMHRIRGMFSHLNGDFTAARREAEAALHLGLAAGHAEARSPYVAMLSVLPESSGLRPAIAELLGERVPQVTTFYWQVFVAWLAILAGDSDRATRVGRMAMETGIETLPRNASWFTIVAVFGDLAIRLKNQEWAQVAYDALEPYADRYLVIANGAVCFGSTERLLGKLADVTGIADAAAHHHRASERNEAISARVWLDDADPTGTLVTRTFMFTDIVGSTSLAELLGDRGWETLLRWHDQALSELIQNHHGDKVKSTGDGFFAAFNDPEAAVSCAIAIQQRLADHRAANGFAPEVRIGLHTALATSVEGDYHGVGVHEAARIGAAANGGEILASMHSAVHQAYRGESRIITLKGITNPVEVVSIAWQRH